MTLTTLNKPTGAAQIIADSGPLIALAISGLLSHLPELCGEVWVPQQVLNECLAKEGAPGFAEIQKSVKDRIIHVHPDTPESDEMIKSLGRLLDPGKAQAIKLALMYHCVLLIDEKSGRSTARSLGIAVTGSLAVLLKAKNTGVIPSVKSVVDKLQQHNYRYSKALIAQLLKKAGE